MGKIANHRTSTWLTWEGKGQGSRDSVEGPGRRGERGGRGAFLSRPVFFHM